ncbi:MAG: O-methyltransferase [Planctomycetota bacterium]
MSSTSTAVTAAHFAYLAERTVPEDAFLADLKAAANEAGIPPIWISPEQASLMQILLKAAGARRVVEVGTLAGYSAIAMARALPPRADGGLLRTIELDPKHASFAADWCGRSDAADRIEVHRGAGAEVLAGFEDDSADAAFLDADKGGYPVYLEHCLRIVRSGGLILVDNAFAFGQLFDENPTDREVPAVRAFNDLMARTPGVHGVIVPMGDGLWVAVVERKG